MARREPALYPYRIASASTVAPVGVRIIIVLAWSSADATIGSPARSDAMPKLHSVLKQPSKALVKQQQKDVQLLKNAPVLITVQASLEPQLNLVFCA